MRQKYSVDIGLWDFFEARLEHFCFFRTFAFRLYVCVFYLPTKRNDTLMTRYMGYTGRPRGADSCPIFCEPTKVIMSVIGQK